jgi:hypothetical protein
MRSLTLRREVGVCLEGASETRGSCQPVSNAAVTAGKISSPARNVKSKRHLDGFQLNSSIRPHSSETTVPVAASLNVMWY